jgi:diguanylate cyclase (GGDEF)-like protein
VSTGKCTLLVVDDEPSILDTISRLAGADFEVLVADSAHAAKEILAHRDVDVLLTDHAMRGTTGVQLLEWIRLNYPNTIRLLMTGFKEVDNAVEAINRGQVHQYIAKPWRMEELQQILRNARDKRRLERKIETDAAELRQLNEQLQRFNVDLEHHVQARTLELQDAKRLLEERQHELERANHQLQVQKRRLRKMALIDARTRLPNVRAMKHIAKTELKRHSRSPRPLAFGLIDLDDLKGINQRYLHSGGNFVLRALAKTLARSLRGSDSVGRWGGDEFLVIAPESDSAGARALAERIRGQVEATTIRYKEQSIHITVSIGFAVAEIESVANYREVNLLYTKLIDLAESAEKGAKEGGKNCCIIQALG